MDRVYGILLCTEPQRAERHWVYQTRTSRVANGAKESLNFLLTSGAGHDLRSFKRQRLLPPS